MSISHWDLLRDKGLAVYQAVNVVSFQPSRDPAFKIPHAAHSSTKADSWDAKRGALCQCPDILLLSFSKPGYNF